MLCSLIISNHFRSGGNRMFFPPTMLDIEFSTAMWNSETWIFVKCMLIINIGITLTFSEMRSDIRVLAQNFSDAWSDLK